MVAAIDWTQAIPEEDSVVDWSLWGTTSQSCGLACDRLHAFIASFGSSAKVRRPCGGGGAPAKPGRSQPLHRRRARRRCWCGATAARGRMIAAPR